MKRNKALFNTLAVVLAGLVISALSVYVETATQALEQKSTSYQILSTTVGEQIAILKTKFDLFHTQGGVSLKDEIIQPAEKLRHELQMSYEGQPNELGGVLQHDEETLMALRTSVLELDEWRNAAEKVGELKTAGSQEGMSDFVQQAATAHLKISAAINGISLRVRDQEKSTQAWLNILFILSIAFLVLFVGFMAVIVYRVQRNSERIAVESKQRIDAEGQRMQQLTTFIEAVSNGNFDIELASNGDADHVTETLRTMRARLKENADTESKRTWATTGQAQIGEILRSTGNSTELFDNIVKFIVKYTRSNQGGLFILNDEDKTDSFLELAACYAFERKKFLTKRVNVGDGIIGQSFLEKEKTHLTEIPEDYVNITSGLGGTTPKSILVVPLKVNDEVYGVLELASFNEYAAHEVEMIEKFAESIAATVSSVKVNERTRELLEQTQQQAEEMKSQEEEMRQNMEELSATQEQLQRQMQEAEDSREVLAQRERVFGIGAIMSESDLFGTITYANDKLTQVSKYSREELLGKGHNIFRHPDMPAALFKMMWDNIRAGNTFQGIVKNRAKDGTHYWVDATIVPIRNKEGEIYKYISARYHITNNDLAEALYQQQAKRLGLEAEVHA